MSEHMEYGPGTAAAVVLEGGTAAPSVVAVMVRLKPEHEPEIDDEEPLQ
jgi:hypothetical protein